MKNRIAPESAFGSAYVSQLEQPKSHRIAEEARKEALKPLKAANGLAPVQHGRGTYACGLSRTDDSTRYTRARLRSL